MFRWIKSNPTLAAGIGLPLALILLFGIAASIPPMLVDPPKYDILFYEDTYTKSAADVTLSVVGGKLQARYKQKENQYNNNAPTLYHYSAQSGITRKIDIVPPDTGTKEWQDFSIEGMSGLTLDTNLTSPDGYTFEPYRYGGGGELTNLFIMGSYHSRGPMIAKSGRTIPLHPKGSRYYGYNAQFLGWVKSE